MDNIPGVESYETFCLFLLKTGTGENRKNNSDGLKVELHTWYASEKQTAQLPLPSFFVW